MQVVECYLPLIQFIASTKADTAGDFTAFRQQVERYLAEAAQASAILVGKDDLHASRFAIMAWVDEWVLCSALALRHEWRDRLLQSEHYQTVVGGEAFFTRFDALDACNHQIRMVYLTCLSLGFQGKYRHLEPAQLRARIASARQALPHAWQPEHSCAEITPVDRQGIKRKRRHLWIWRYRFFLTLTVLWAMVSVGLLFTFL
ncbi:hypothetical protein HMPREF3173_11060 [Pseudomonas sp. HMSC08G10]|nr:hypothetical protein HMPREF3173_11060 [Pseudomonas sp. HMSC08G10]